MELMCGVCLKTDSDVLLLEGGDRCFHPICIYTFIKNSISLDNQLIKWQAETYMIEQTLYVIYTTLQGHVRSDNITEIDLHLQSTRTIKTLPLIPDFESRPWYKNERTLPYDELMFYMTPHFFRRTSDWCIAIFDRLVHVRTKDMRIYTIDLDEAYLPYNIQCEDGVMADVLPAIEYLRCHVNPAVSDAANGVMREYGVHVDIPIIPFEPPKVDKPTVECNICRDTTGVIHKMDQCVHTFHSHCLRTYFRQLVSDHKKIVCPCRCPVEYVTVCGVKDGKLYEVQTMLNQSIFVDNKFSVTDEKGNVTTVAKVPAIAFKGLPVYNALTEPHLHLADHIKSTVYFRRTPDWDMCYIPRISKPSIIYITPTEQYQRIGIIRDTDRKIIRIDSLPDNLDIIQQVEAYLEKHPSPPSSDPLCVSDRKCVKIEPF